MYPTSEARRNAILTSAMPLGGLQGVGSALALEAGLPVGHGTRTSLDVAQLATLGGTAGTVLGGIIGRHAAGEWERRKIQEERAGSLVKRLRAFMTPRSTRRADEARIQNTKTRGMSGGMLAGNALGGMLGSAYATRNLDRDMNTKQASPAPMLLGAMPFGGMTLPSAAAGVAAYNQDSGPTPGRSGMLTAAGSFLGRGAGGTAGGTLGASAGEALMMELVRRKRDQEGFVRRTTGRLFGRHSAEDRQARAQGSIGGAAVGSILGSSVGGGIGARLAQDYAMKTSSDMVPVPFGKEAGIKDTLAMLARRGAVALGTGALGLGKAVAGFGEANITRLGVTPQAMRYGFENNVSNSDIRKLRNAVLHGIKPQFPGGDSTPGMPGRLRTAYEALRGTGGDIMDALRGKSRLTSGAPDTMRGQMGALFDHGAAELDAWGKRVGESADMIRDDIQAVMKHPRFAAGPNAPYAPDMPGKQANYGMQGVPAGSPMMVPVQQSAAPMMGFGGSMPAVGGQFAGGTAGSAIGAMLGGMLAEKKFDHDFKQQNFLRRLVTNQSAERAQAGQQGQLVGSMLGSLGGQFAGGLLGSRAHQPSPVYMAMQAPQ